MAPRYFRTNEGERHSSREQIRVQQRFRWHIYTPRNPRGRIIRPSRCWKCPRKAGKTPIEAHHIDYAQPFVVAWLCFSCHRRVEAGTLKLYSRDLHDYTSLINHRPKTYAKG